MSKANGERQMVNRAAAYRRLGMYLLPVACYLLVACGASLPAALGGPTPAPTAAIDPYNGAVATAEALGDPAALARAFYERANLLLDQGEASAARADYDRSIELDRTNARAFNNRGLAHLALGATEIALANYNEAIRLDPGYVRAYINRTAVLEQQGDLPALAADYQTLAMLVPERAADYQYQAGVALAGIPDRVNARRAFDTALQHNPEHVDALYERGLLQFAEGSPTDAIDDFDAALRLSPRAANAYYARGLAYAALGNPQQAHTDFTEALRLKPNDAAALVARAAAAYTLGDSAAAHADLAQAQNLPLTPGTAEAIAALQQQLDQSE